MAHSRRGEGVGEKDILVDMEHSWRLQRSKLEEEIQKLKHEVPATSCPVATVLRASTISVAMRLPLGI